MVLEELTVSENLRKCPVCQAEKPELNEEGRHNFAPHVVEGQVVSICMKCKSAFDKAHYEQDQHSSPSH